MRLVGIVQRMLWGDDVVRVPTALDPTIWTCATACPCFPAAAHVFQAARPLVYVLVALAALPMLVAQVTHVHLMLRDSDRSQAVVFESAPSGRK